MKRNREQELLNQFHLKRYENNFEIEFSHMLITMF